jgi:hypothetical protein
MDNTSRAPTERLKEGTHRWASCPQEEMPLHKPATPGPAPHSAIEELRPGPPGRPKCRCQGAGHCKGEVTVRDLVRNALRMRPDRIIVGEVRGGEALDMVQAMNTGHDGSLSSAHANIAGRTLRGPSAGMGNARTISRVSYTYRLTCSGPEGDSSCHRSSSPRLSTMSWSG